MKTEPASGGEDRRVATILARIDTVAIAASCFAFFDVIVSLWFRAYLQAATAFLFIVICMALLRTGAAHRRLMGANWALMEANEVLVETNGKLTKHNLQLAETLAGKIVATAVEALDGEAPKGPSLH